ncbi:MAG: glutamine amidotransferase family protein [Candidatus Aenigmatarchaeota archaeon]
MNHMFQKDISGCGLVGIINRRKEKFSGQIIRDAICEMNERGNGLGAGFAAYGIYEDLKDLYAIHVMFYNPKGIREAEEYFEKYLYIEKREPIPIGRIGAIKDNPIIYRYFVLPKREGIEGSMWELDDDDFIVRVVMKVNSEIDGAYVFSSGKNMGVFKGVGHPSDIAEFYRIDEYEGYMWIAHTRFPTNTPGWWGGAHPFNLLDWAIVHNGEISSYGINKRYLEMFGYKLTLYTDTEVVTYFLDLLIRKHGLDIKLACYALTPPFWKDIDGMDGYQRELWEAIRMVYGSAVLNGPFAIVFAYSKGMVGLNDRIKLRPLVAAKKGDFTYIASEEAAIREVCSSPDVIWHPKAGEPVIAEFIENERENFEECFQVL